MEQSLKSLRDKETHRGGSNSQPEPRTAAPRDSDINNRTQSHKCQRKAAERIMDQRTHLEGEAVESILENLPSVRSSAGAGAGELLFILLPIENSSSSHRAKALPGYDRQFPIPPHHLVNRCRREETISGGMPSSEVKINTCELFFRLARSVVCLILLRCENTARPPAPTITGAEESTTSIKSVVANANIDRLISSFRSTITIIIIIIMMIVVQVQ
uniref:Uncharacterized protein n=1 Tax=Anopheles atroparvus TaxID=41427 RepID=A0A182ILU1_ANOAO